MTVKNDVHLTIVALYVAEWLTPVKKIGCAQDISNLLKNRRITGYHCTNVAGVAQW